MQNLNERVTVKATKETGTVITRTHGYVTVQLDSGRQAILYENEVTTQQFLQEIENDGQDIL